MATLTAGRIARPGLARGLVDALDAGAVVLVAGPGYGKTMALEEALERSSWRAVWIGCGEAGGGAGRLLMSVVAGLRTAVPGVADVLGDRLVAGIEPLDVRTAVGALLTELEGLLLERVVIVFDDAEELEHAPESLALIDRLLGVRAAPLSLAVATRRALPLRLAKLRAAGKLAEFGPAELSFTASECQELLCLRHGRTVSAEEVEAVVGASEGWPMGVALTGLTGANGSGTGAVSRGELFHYLAEEVFDRLDPAVRLGLVDSSVPDALTPELAAELGLPPDFLEETERSGLFLRAQVSGTRSYHPLFRSFLREHLLQLRTEEERAALHARAATSLTASGRHAEAVEHWLEAGQFEQALAALATHGAELVRLSPGAVGGWLSALPAWLHREPDYLFLEAQLMWGAGRHERAVERLRAAIAGFRALGSEDREWLARVVLADALFFIGDFAGVSAAAEGWLETSSPVARAVATAVAWYEVTALSSVGRIEEAELIRERLDRDPVAAAPFSFLGGLTRGGVELVAGRIDAALAQFHATIAELERGDPFARLPYALGMVLITLRTVGRREAALEWVGRCEREAERVGLRFAVDDFRFQRASLLAQLSDLPGAEVSLARAGKRPVAGWRAMFEVEAEAHVALLRGDTALASEAAGRAVRCAAAAPVNWRVRATLEMAAVLSEAGEPASARRAVDATLAALDEMFPGERGRGTRALLLASRAQLEYKLGEADVARRTMRECFTEAGSAADQVVRAHWPAIRPVLWHALAEGAITPQTVLAAMQDAFPRGEALMAMIDHPNVDVRRAALLNALAAGHPAVLSRLAELERDTDAQVAAAASATREHVRGNPPPLRFELLGGFQVSRAGWALYEAVWKRPMASRVVRFLLIQDSGSVTEDILFEAFWPDRPADAARQHLAQAVSRARKVLDIPGAEHSVIENKERTYRMRLRDRDSVDAAEFEAAAAAALADRGHKQQTALETAAAMWTGEPLPEDRYAPWSFAWRERLEQTYAHVLSALMETYDNAGEHDHAIRAASRLLRLDPLNERAHRQLMVAYARTGRKSQALRQFLECRRALVSDLGVEPSVETSALQARILADDPV